MPTERRERRELVRRAAAAVAMLVAAGVFSGQASGQLTGPPGLRPPPTAAARAGDEKFSAAAVVSARSIRPGDSLHLAVRLEIAPGYWVYGPVPGGTTIQVTPLTVKAGPSPLAVGEPLFPPTHEHVADVGVAKDTFNVYEGTAVVYVPVRAPADVPPGKYEVHIEIDAQVCDPNTCLLPRVNLSAVVEVGQVTAESPEWTGALKDGLPAARSAAQWRAAVGVAPPGAPRPGGLKENPPYADLGILTGLGLAFLAGLILNVMPCVLPVIPLKILSLVEQSRQSRRRLVLLGACFMGGMVLFFAGLAGLSVVLNLAFDYSFQWGDHFRQPAFVIGMALLLVVLAASMFGFFTVGVPGRLAGGRTGEGCVGAAGAGLLSALLSTPCSFGTLAAALIWAQHQPLWLGSTGLIVMGLGMASPYAVLTAFPGALSRIPRAGRWTELLRQSMGFVLLLVAVWLLSTQQPGSPYLFWVVAYGVVLAMCLWVWGTWVRYDAPVRRRWTIRAAAAAAAVAAGVWMLGPIRPLAVDFQPYDGARIAAARGSGRIVLIDFTASWCLTCKWVEHTVYDDRRVARALEDKGVLAVKGDVTTRDSPAARLLTELGEQGVPVTVILPPGDAPPIRLRGLFGSAALLDALDGIR